MRAYEGVLAAYEVQVAGPQQFIVVLLAHEGHEVHAEGARREMPAHLRLGVQAGCARSAARPSGTSTAPGGAVAPLLQQVRQGRVGVGEQAHLERLGERLRVQAVPQRRLARRRCRGRPRARRRALFLAAGCRYPARSRGKEMLGQRQARMRRRHGVVVAHPRLGAQVPILIQAGCGTRVAMRARNGSGRVQAKASITTSCGTASQNTVVAAGSSRGQGGSRRRRCVAAAPSDPARARGARRRSGRRPRAAPCGRAPAPAGAPAASRRRYRRSCRSRCRRCPRNGWA